MSVSNTTTDFVEFVSPKTGSPLRRDGDVLRSDDGHTFDVVEGIPRFVSSDNYAAAFGLEWNEHPHAQLDSKTGSALSRRRLERCLGRSLETLEGQMVLEAGCGAGRFTELLVEVGAIVHAVDLSTAVEANRRNIGGAPNYVVAQADIRRLPFPAESFDVVLCIGVLQHTPSPEKSMEALYAMVRPGGDLVVDHYTWSLSIVTKLAPLYRLWLKSLEPDRAKAMTDRMVDVFFPLHWKARKVRLLQMALSRFSPCLVYFSTFPELDREQHYELTRLDTYDHLTDQYKRLRTVGQIRRHLRSLGAVDVKAVRGGNGVEARCRKPIT